MKITSLSFLKIRTADLLWVVFLFVPALYLNLEKPPLIGDEAIRALVSLEMMISGDYLTPTLNGELYFNKPPLFNWILVLFFRIFHSNSELICRLPTTLFLLAYCYTIFWWVRKQLGSRYGIIAALMFLTCARILFYDSFLGLIDVLFSWLVFLNFMLIWHFFQKRRFPVLFLSTYAILAVTFLLKGLPSLAFQGITLLTLFIYTGHFRKLFSWAHIAGIVVFVLLISAYYYPYYLHHPDDTTGLLLRLVSESTQKSALGVRIGETFKHMVSFPFEMVYHFAPWTILLIMAFNRSILKRAFSNSFIKYCILVFAANIIIYWLSPITYPRYLHMLVPLLFIALLYLIRFHALSNTVSYRIVMYIIFVLTIMLIVVYTIMPILFHKLLPVSHIFLKSVLLLIPGIFLFYKMYLARKRMNTLFGLGLVLLISRISFNLFLVPYRQTLAWPEKCREDAIRLGQGTKGEELFLLTDTITIPNAYYITRERNEILRFVNVPTRQSYYIVDDTAWFDGHFTREFTMRSTISRKHRFYAGRFNPAPK